MTPITKNEIVLMRASEVLAIFRNLDVTHYRIIGHDEDFMDVRELREVLGFHTVKELQCTYVSHFFPTQAHKFVTYNY